MPQEITLETIFDAPIDHVWQAWTDPARMTWFGSDPEGRVISAEAHVRVGGIFRVKFRNSDETEFVCHGTYREVERSARLSFTWEWENEPGTISYVTVSLAPAGDRTTRMHFSHANLWEGSAHDYLEGWRSTFSKLANTLNNKL
ncbi:MAG TPA: SRPBCC domain-containing protein [Puia sp.]|jgi:uncharacterized protein YndB with AHSA1/START domain|nr:SRPBCC domain-containing protein [Puia sp.]